ncbi:uncharacterized protein LAJ45_00355 [Morchella importuna]|uniref:uncharacterized protein n=1 Tax=Morchella importuna TaxID=1174673 RepID=UPI001E8DABE7|nr:uncharacterized protein LAJ45_00355 [Morchella importuna]KAH8155345.1 hypothetical protein LAJ45_00355 [Morchella importuna]
MEAHYGASSSSSKRPRIESAPQPSGHPAISTQVPVFSPLGTLVDSRTHMQTATEAHPSPIYSLLGPAGQANLFERLNGAQRLTSSSPSRPEGFGRGGFSVGNRTTGAVGGSSFSRQHQSFGRGVDAPAPTKPGPGTGNDFIDLTADDDDEVLEVEPKEVCFGMISSSKVSAHTVPTPLPGSDKFQHAWPPIPIALKRGGNASMLTICAFDTKGKEFGCVDINTARALVPLLDMKIVRTVARTCGRAKNGEILGGPITPSDTGILILINLYGQEDKATTVGNILTQKGVQLHEPIEQPEKGIEYKNPQLRNGVRQVWEAGKTRGPNVGYLARTADEIRTDVNKIFDRLEESDSVPEMEADPRIKTPLLKHQKQGLYFMTNKEKEQTFSEDSKVNSSIWRIQPRLGGQKVYLNIITGVESREKPTQVLGGILADMMGLGKTLQIISLAVGSLEEAKMFAKKKIPTPKGKEKGNENLSIRNSRSTLLICPLSTIGNWEEQIKAHLDENTLNTYVYHGSKRETDLNKLAEYDLIITTYQVIANEYQKYQKDNEKISPLQKMCFFRIVLDEAHMIREQSTLQSKAVIALNAQRRWAVTGTPIQNKLDDLAALIKFLRVKPFDDKATFNLHIATPFKNADPDCVPKLRLLVNSVTLRRLKDKLNLPPRNDQIVYLEFSPEEREIYDATARQSTARMDLVVKTGHVGGRAYVHVLQSILRLRLICAHGRELLGSDDTAGLTSSDAIDVDELEEKTGSSWSVKQAYEIFKLMKEANEDVCSICRKKVNTPINNEAETKAEGKTSGSSKQLIGHLTPCAHLICVGCVGTYKGAISENFREGQQASCPVCGIFSRVHLFDLLQEDLAAEEDIVESVKPSKKKVPYRGPSTKVKALTKMLLENKKESTPENPIKSVVFSCWTSHMDLIELAFNANKIKFVRLDGRLSRAQRDRAMADFRREPDIEVILISIMAGGLGLNLTDACKVYVMEPQFNPAAEAQAIDRIHRLGQTRPVTTVRFIMSNSFEGKILQLQRKKMDLAKLSMQKLSRSELTKQRLEDLRSLFK